MDGYEVARRLRQRPGFECVVIAALTGWGQLADRQRSKDAGIDHHFLKPVDSQTLVVVLDGGHVNEGAAAMKPTLGARAD